ncbi:MAG: hypothetical protein EBR82_75940 [Caulobacteraceae bacterium]|nr:hypothetical protein [Caulobacteraceae bacterium]
MVKFEMDYADACMLEFALYEFIGSQKQEIHRLQTLPERSLTEKAQLKECENRLRNTNHALRVVVDNLNAANEEVCDD